MGVSPFRNPWVTGYVRLSTAFRSLSRLSSALSAKASTLRSFLLNLANPSADGLFRFPSANPSVGFPQTAPIFRSVSDHFCLIAFTMTTGLTCLLLHSRMS